MCVCVRDKGRETGVEKKREIEAGDRVMNPNAQPLAPAHQLCLNAVILLTESRRVVCERMHALERERECVCERERERQRERERTIGHHSQYALKNRETWSEKEGGGLRYKHHSSSCSPTSPASFSTQEDRH